MTESYIRFYDKQRADNVIMAQERAYSVFRDRHPDAEIQMIRTELADEDESHDYQTQIQGEY